MAYLGVPGEGSGLSTTPDADFDQGLTRPCDISNPEALTAADALPLTLIDTAQRPPTSVAVMVATPNSQFCFSQSAQHLLVTHPKGPIHTAYAGGGLLSLHAASHQPAWRRLPAAVAQFALHSSEPPRQLGRSHFLLQGNRKILVLDARSGASLAVTCGPDEELTGAQSWCAHHAHFAFATADTLRIFTTLTNGSLALFASLPLDTARYGPVTQIRLLGDTPNLTCLVATTHQSNTIWLHHASPQVAATQWEVIAQGKQPLVTVGGNYLDPITMADSYASHAHMLLMGPSTLAAPSAEPALDLVAFRLDGQTWRRQLLTSVPFQVEATTWVDLAPADNLLVAYQDNDKQQIASWDKDPVPTKLTLPAWLDAPKKMFFSPLNRDLIALFSKPLDPASLAHAIGFPAYDPDHRAKHGEADWLETLGWGRTTDHTRVMASFQMREDAWTLRWAKWVDNFEPSNVSRDGTAIVLSEYWNQTLIDLSD